MSIMKIINEIKKSNEMREIENKASEMKMANNLKYKWRREEGENENNQ